MESGSHCRADGNAQGCAGAPLVRYLGTMHCGIKGINSDLDAGNDYGAM